MRFDFKNRFEEKYIPEPMSGCWLWIGQYQCNGYGVISRFKNKKGRKNVMAHRAAYEIYNGEIKEGLLVCHKCDNRLCVNPKHLFLGTAQDNTNDMIFKGRQVTPKSTNKNKTHCKRGHELISENIYKLKNNKQRSCKICGSLRSKFKRLKLKEQK